MNHLESPLAYAPKTRHFVAPDFAISDWEGLEPYLLKLLEAQPHSLDDLLAWIRQTEELQAVINETAAWRYIDMSRDTLNEYRQQAFQDYVRHIQPSVAQYEDKLHRKLLAHPHFDKLPAEYGPYLRAISKQVELFREENLALATEATTLAQQYSTLNAGMVIEFRGQELTPQQAAKLLEEQDRELRKDVWETMHARRWQDRDRMEDIFDKLIGLRQQMAKQAGYANYTRFRFEERGRFDYKIEDTYAFHNSVEKAVKPIISALQRERKERMGLHVLRPYDVHVDMYGATPLRPFEGAGQLLEGVVHMLDQLDPQLAHMLRTMDSRGYLDLESRKGKMPGGYNYPLMESGIPFIFMNAAGTPSDVITMLHESGHAIHSFLTRDLPVSQRSFPSEVAELAAMSMELLPLPLYGEFYPDPADRSRAQKTQLARCITVLPWIAAIDAFQQWVYDHEGHTREERMEAWKLIYFRFHGEEVDWSGYEHFLHVQWIKQMHVFEYPFYYIEYGLAQLGALAIWRNSLKDPAGALQGYLKALSLGYTQPIPKIYEAAGIQFDFSEDYVRQSVDDCFAAYQSW